MDTLTWKYLSIHPASQLIVQKISHPGTKSLILILVPCVCSPEIGAGIIRDTHVIIGMSRG